MRAPASLLVSAALVLSGCGREGDEDLPPPQPRQSEAARADADKTRAAPHTPEPPAPRVAQEPVSVAANAIVLGRKAGDRVEPVNPPLFGLDDTVVAAAPLPNAADGAPTQVYWTYQDGTAHKQESRPVENGGVSYTFSKADGMKAGKYNVEIDLADRPIGLVEFEVR